MKKNYRKNNGITLIALVITIIVLLILAGITIATLTGENGLLNKTTRAKAATILAEAKDQCNLIATEVVAKHYEDVHVKGQEGNLDETLVTVLSEKEGANLIANGVILSISGGNGTGAQLILTYTNTGESVQGVVQNGVIIWGNISQANGPGENILMNSNVKITKIETIQNSIVEDDEEPITYYNVKTTAEILINQETIETIVITPIKDVGVLNEENHIWENNLSFNGDSRFDEASNSSILEKDEKSNILDMVREFLNSLMNAKIEDFEISIDTDDIYLGEREQDHFANIGTKPIVKYRELQFVGNKNDLQTAITLEESATNADEKVLVVGEAAYNPEYPDAHNGFINTCFKKEGVYDYLVTQIQAWAKGLTVEQARNIINSEE